jgi:hypothetical protein
MWLWNGPFVPSVRLTLDDVDTAYSTVEINCRNQDRQRQGSGALSWPSQARPEGIAAPKLPQSQGRQARVGSPTSRALVATRRMLRRRFLAQPTLQVASWKKPTRLGRGASWRRCGQGKHPPVEPCYNRTPRGNSMGNVSSIIKQLTKERDRAERQLSGLNAALVAFASVYNGNKPARKSGR